MLLKLCATAVGNLRFALLGDGEEEVIGARFLLIDEDIYVHMYRQVSLFSLSAVVRLQKEIGLAEYGEVRRPAGKTRAGLLEILAGLWTFRRH